MSTCQTCQSLGPGINGLSPQPGPPDSGRRRTRTEAYREAPTSSVGGAGPIRRNPRALAKAPPTNPARKGKDVSATWLFRAVPRLLHSNGPDWQPLRPRRLGWRRQALGLGAPRTTLIAKKEAKSHICRTPGAEVCFRRLFDFNIGLPGRVAHPSPILLYPPPPPHL
jgi:hypothetical protein